MPEEEKQEQTQPEPGAKASDADAISVDEVELEELESMPHGSALSLKVVMDIAMPVTVELGRTEVTVQELLRLRNGSVIELQKMAGEPVEVYIRDVCFARGEVVVVENNFGVRITEIINPSQPLEGLEDEAGVQNGRGKK